MSIAKASHCTFLICCLAVTPTLFAQESTSGQETFEAMLRETSQDIANEDIREIVEIRRRLGGGLGLDVKSVLSKDHSVHCPPDSTLVGAMADNLQIQLSEPSLAAKLFLKAVNNHRLIAHNQATENESRKTRKSLALRLIAKRLETLAADMEDLELYEGADSLRKKAQQIRFSVRKTNESRTAQVDEQIR